LCRVWTWLAPIPETQHFSLAETSLELAATTFPQSLTTPQTMETDDLQPSSSGIGATFTERL
jgi:hypothetical protein